MMQGDVLQVKCKLQIEAKATGVFTQSLNRLSLTGFAEKGQKRDLQYIVFLEKPVKAWIVQRVRGERNPVVW